jgi:hypothetical protein
MALFFGEAMETPGTWSNILYLGFFLMASP